MAPQGRFFGVAYHVFEFFPDCRCNPSGEWISQIGRAGLLQIFEEVTECFDEKRFAAGLRAGAGDVSKDHLTGDSIRVFPRNIREHAVMRSRQGRLRVPDDVAIIGFDNIIFSGLIYPALTTIHVDKYEIGRRSTLLLLQMLNEPDQVYPIEYVDTELVVRESA